MLAFKEFERAKALVSTQLSAVTESSSENAHYTQREKSSKWCDYCKSRTHNSKDCWTSRRPKRRLNDIDRTTDESSTGRTITCFYCGEDGHRKNECPVRIRAERARERIGKERVRREGQAHITTVDNESRVTHHNSDEEDPGL